MATPTTRPRRARALAVIAATLAALAVWLITDPLLGIDLTGTTRPGSQQLQPITPALVAGASLAVALAGWALLALLERFTARARTIWTAVALLVALLSLAGPMSILASTEANVLALALMHLAVAAVLIPMLAGTSPAPAGQHQPARHAPAGLPTAPTTSSQTPTTPTTQPQPSTQHERRTRWSGGSHGVTHAGHRRHGHPGAAGRPAACGTPATTSASSAGPHRARKAATRAGRASSR